MKVHKHSNALIHESSPYLLQHAHNPVNWHPWGEEALIKAKKENKPLLISIGYSACHWCHVMERESFENEEVAILMNEKFICIKVDREERPDVDNLYMNAVQLMTQQGGWPLNAFAMPDGRPFYGGTYFPKDKWIGVLKQVSELYNKQHNRVEEYAEQLLSGISQMN
ncbi:MAG: thioredoxin domain-containing protein, partial [Bacteroidetes bacterium]|nr:thioredoxin domain-containing protein [Bacteroidota bacterium]